jgi:hypothetical protein
MVILDQSDDSDSLRWQLQEATSYTHCLYAEMLEHVVKYELNML